jgi:uncharacterized membrane protein YhaH (DUF805 family)
MPTQTFGRRGLPQPPPGSHIRRDAPPPEPNYAAETSARQLGWWVFSTQGRVTRLHYWLGQVALFVVFKLVTVSAHAVRTSLGAGASSRALSPLALSAAIIALVVIMICLGAGLWAGFALVVKRWHDRDKSWPWALLGFIPLVGWVWQGIECGFLEGTLGPNRYGASPKGNAGVLYADPLAETFA